MLQRYSHEIDDAILSVTEEERSRLDAPFQQRNLRFLLLITMAIFSLFTGRLVYLGIYKGDQYAQASRGNAIRVIPIEAPRGKIFDRKGHQLVYNLPSTNLVLHVEKELSLEDENHYMALADIFSLPKESIQEAFHYIRTSSYSEIILKQNVSQEEILIFSEREHEFPAVTLKKSVRRNYEESAIFSHILGYESILQAQDVEKYPNYLLTDSVGRQGIEKQYEAELRGEHGGRRVEVDALGRIRREISSQLPKPGNDLVLSIDADLQKNLYDFMKEELMKNDLTRGAAVALNPNNGEVLAMVSFPTYDNNIFSQQDPELYSTISGNPDQPLFNRAVSGEYPPASTIKPVLATAALDAGIISPSLQIESQGGINVGNTFFGDWKVHGNTDIRRAIAVSSDVYFYSIGGGYGGVKGMGMEMMKEYEKRFGYGEKTGIDIPSESPGFIPDPEWKQRVIGERWYIGNTYHASIGQGFMKATPLQVALSTSIIANGGTFYTPHIVSYIRDAQGEIVKRSDVDGRDTGLSQEALKIVREGMRQTVTEGTALSLNTLTVEVAGKTGTAQYGPDDKTHGWFVSFAPYENPEIVLAVLVESQALDGYHAVPITKRVYEAYFEGRNR